MADGMGKMLGGKHRQHLALPSQLKQQTVANRFASPVADASANGLLTAAYPYSAARAYDSTRERFDSVRVGA
jgi:hypothetical protein